MKEYKRTHRILGLATDRYNRVPFSEIENTMNEQIWDGKRGMISFILTFKNRQAYIVFPFSYSCFCHWMY